MIRQYSCIGSARMVPSVGTNLVQSRTKRLPKPHASKERHARKPRKLAMVSLRVSSLVNLYLAPLETFNPTNLS